MVAAGGPRYELQIAEAVKILHDYSAKVANEYLLDFSGMYLDTEKEQFITIFPEEIRKILVCKEVMKKKISMLKYFVALIGTFNWSKGMSKLQGKIGTMPVEYIASQADSSQRTCIRYNEILSEMKMIYIYKSNDKVRDGDRLRQIKNCYSRYGDKDICEEYASNYENWYGCQHKIMLTQKNKEQADNNRRLAQIYNRILEGYGDTYDKVTIMQVHKYITNKNKTLQKEIDAKYAQKYMTDSDKVWVEKLKKQLRDESIFEQFDFLQAPNNSDSRSDDNWGEPVPMEKEFSIEEILDMPVMGEVQMNLTNMDCMGQNDLCENESHCAELHDESFYITEKD